MFFFFKQKTAYEVRISDWSSDVCSSDLVNLPVIANGDICSIEDAELALEQSGADGVMIGRGAHGKPWLLAQVMQWFATGQRRADPGLDAIGRASCRERVCQSVSILVVAVLL